jgi:galactokinase
MEKASQLIGRISHGALKELIPGLYGDPETHEKHKGRFIELLERHITLFGDREDVRIFSVPGRTELSGNHTDHNHGHVLAASVHLDTIAAVSPTPSYQAVLDSVGYQPVRVDLQDLEPQHEQRGTTDALVRGIAQQFSKNGIELSGFRANSSSEVFEGSGLSSSAAVEILIASIFNNLYADDRFGPVDLAQFGKYAENVHFGKPSGLMDQIACAIGGVASIDFIDPETPRIKNIQADFHASGYTLCVVNTGGSHANLTDNYAAIPQEMYQCARLFGQDTLRGIRLEQLVSQADRIRRQAGDRAFLRSYHFISEDLRAQQMAKALTTKDIDWYLTLCRESGISSSSFLQNLYPPVSPDQQGIPVAIALTEAFLKHTGACRVHGGGFAGTMQAYIPNELFTSYQQYMEQTFGKGSVTPLRIRQTPAGRIL